MFRGDKYCIGQALFWNWVNTVGIVTVNTNPTGSTTDRRYINTGVTFIFQPLQISEANNYWQILGKPETMIAYCSEIFLAFSDHLPCNLIFVIEYLSFFRRLFKGVLKDLPLHLLGALYFNNSGISFFGRITEWSDTINFVCFIRLFTDLLYRETWIYGGFAKKVCNSQGSIVQMLHGQRTQTRGHRLWIFVLCAANVATICVQCYLFSTSPMPLLVTKIPRYYRLINLQVMAIKALKFWLNEGLFLPIYSLAVQLTGYEVFSLNSTE